MISAFVTRTELSVHQSCQRRCVCHWVGTEQARLCGEGGLGTWSGASEASSDPPMCCWAALFPRHNAKHLLGPDCQTESSVTGVGRPNAEALCFYQQISSSGEAWLMSFWQGWEKMEISCGQFDILLWKHCWISFSQHENVACRFKQTWHHAITILCCWMEDAYGNTLHFKCKI